MKTLAETVEAADYEDARARALSRMVEMGMVENKATPWWRRWSPLTWWRVRRARAKAMARIAEFNRQISGPTHRNH